MGTTSKAGSTGRFLARALRNGVAAAVLGTERISTTARPRGRSRKEGAMSRIISTTRGLVPNVRRVTRLLVVSTALAAALGVAGQAVPAQAWVEAARGRQPGAMTLSAAPIGCTSNHYIAVPRGSTVSVGVSPATGSNLVADACAHVVVSVQRWTGSSWGPCTTYDWPNSTALPGNYYNY